MLCLSSVSHKVIEEVNGIQENLEIEKTCRQSVEALASKVSDNNPKRFKLAVVVFVLFI